MRTALKVMNSFHVHKGLPIPFYVYTENTENPLKCLAGSVCSQDLDEVSVGHDVV